MSIRSVRIDFAVALISIAIGLSAGSSDAQLLRLPSIPPMVPNMNVPNLAGLNFPRARCEMMLSGRVFPLGEPLPRNARVMKLRINNTVVPMVVDGEEGGAEDPFAWSLRDEYLQEVYRSILVKEVLIEVDQDSDQT